MCKQLKAAERNILKLNNQVDNLLIIIANNTLSINLNNDTFFDVTNIRKVVSDYVGREDVLDNLKAYFNLTHHDVPIAVVIAVGGTGKTQVVLRYAFVNKLDYGQDDKYQVYWIAAETIDSLVTSYRDLAQRLKIPTDNVSDKDVLHAVRSKLLDFPQTLFIFDNVVNFRSINKYLPLTKTSGSNHHVLITTRIEGDWPATMHLEKLNAFSEREAEVFITNADRFATHQDISALSNEFNNLPLALSQATSYMTENDLTVKEYLDYYHKHQVHQTTEIDENGKILSLYIIFNRAFKMLFSTYMNNLIKYY
jgi:hypothetical protein